MVTALLERITLLREQVQDLTSQTLTAAATLQAARRRLEDAQVPR